MEIVLDWHRFESLSSARTAFRARSCVYVQADAAGYPVRVGMASKGLEARYRGGTGWALDAAMHQSGNAVFVAAVPDETCGVVEAALIWEHRAHLTYNQQGKRRPPIAMQLVHRGECPRWARPG